MTRQQIASVVKSAREAEARIEADNAAWKADAAQDRSVWLPKGIARTGALVPEIRALFDSQGADRLIAEQPGHRHATRVRRAKWRVDTLPDSVEVLEIIWEFEQRETELTAQREQSSTWAIELKAQCAETLEGLRAVRARYAEHAAVKIDKTWASITQDRLRLIDGLIAKVTERQAAVADEAAAQRATGLDEPH